MSRNRSLVLLPGLLCDAALWHHQVETLADMAEIVVPDLTRDETVALMARRVIGQAPERFALAGLSMGGYVAFEILRQVPDRVERLALIDTSARADTADQTKHRQALIELSRQGPFRGVTRRLLPQLIHPSRLDDVALAETIYAMAERSGPEAFSRQEQAIMLRPDSRHDLGLIHCPTVVVCGREDALTPLAVAREMAEKIPRAALVAVEDCGHLAPLERPRTVSAVLRYWLQV
jgi:pimeloyl-ACP methyl ester carboxylesterase